MFHSTHTKLHTLANLGGKERGKNNNNKKTNLQKQLEAILFFFSKIPFDNFQVNKVLFSSSSHSNVAVMMSD